MRWAVGPLLCAVHSSGFPRASGGDPPAGIDITSAASLTVGFIFLLIVVLVVIAIRRRLDEQRVREAMADAAFEMEVMAAFRTPDSMAPVFESGQQFEPVPVAPVSNESSAPAAPAFAEHAPVTAVAAPAALSALSQTTDFQHERADVAAASALSQLRHAGMINDIDGYVEVNGNPQGAAILHLKDGRRALLIPYHETEAFTRRNLRRFDLLIFVGRDGKAVVVNSLENIIADRLSSRMG